MLVNVPVTEMQRNIRRDAVKYITQSLTDTEWYEYRVNIYDTEGRYMQHLERLMLVITDLELGFALGERWTRDHALALYSVTAYQVRIFSLLPPQRVKKILIGLEFDQQGRRFADMDLYYRNKKVEYNSLDAKARKEGRAKLALAMRGEVLDRLSEESRRRFSDMEEKLNRRGQ